MKRIVLTGGTTGLGKAIAARLIDNGNTLHVLSRSPIEKWQAAMGDRAAKAVYHSIDVTQFGPAGEALKAAAQAMGGLDVLINNAGVMAFEAAGSATEASVRKHIATNLEAPIHLSSVGVKIMLDAIPSAPAGGEAGAAQAAPAGPGGQIINISSVAGLKATPKLAVYSATKAGLIHYTRSLAAEMAEKNIRANVVCPGAVQTNLTNRIMFEMIKKAVPLKALQSPEEVAGLIAWLVSDEARSVTGSVFSLDGGMSL